MTLEISCKISEVVAVRKERVRKGVPQGRDTCGKTMNIRLIVITDIQH